MICRQDADYYGFDARAEILRAGIGFSHQSGDLARLFRSTGEAVAESLSYRDVEQIELDVPADDIYVLEALGATRSVSNVYDLVISRRQPGLPGHAAVSRRPILPRRRVRGRGVRCAAVAAAARPNASLPRPARIPPGSVAPAPTTASRRSNAGASSATPASASRTSPRAVCSRARAGRAIAARTTRTARARTSACLCRVATAHPGCAGDDCAPGTICADVPGDCNVPRRAKACAGPKTAGRATTPAGHGMSALMRPRGPAPACAACSASASSPAPRGVAAVPRSRRPSRSTSSPCSPTSFCPGVAFKSG